MGELRDQHKAFAEWFLQQNPVAPDVEEMAWAAWKAALSAPDDAEPVAWAVVLDGLVKQPTLSKVAAERLAEAWRRDADDVEIRPLYAHPPRSGWRPASEPPEEGKDVLVWVEYFEADLAGLVAVEYPAQGNYTAHYGWEFRPWNFDGWQVMRPGNGYIIKGWRDIEPPEIPAGETPQPINRAGAKLYAKKDHRALGEHYLRHVCAMTSEGLHAKSDIAAELAWRDMRIEALLELATTIAIGGGDPQEMAMQTLSRLVSFQGCIEPPEVTP